MRQSFPRLRFVHAQKHVMMYIALLFTMLGVVPVFSQNPFVLMQVDTTNKNFPIRVFLEANPRNDVASITITATNPTNIAAIQVVDTNKFLGFPIGENGVGIATTSDTGFIPRQGMLLANILTDNTTRNQSFVANFLNRNGESLYSQTISVTIASTVTLAPPCNRNNIDFSTGLNLFTPSNTPNAIAVDNGWTFSNFPYNASTAIPAMAYNYGWGPPRLGSYWFRIGEDGVKRSYRKYFCSSIATTATLNFYALVDGAAQINVNGMPVGGSTIWATYYPPYSAMTITSVPIVVGQNYIEVVIQDTPNNPAGFCLSTATISIPTGALGLAGSACCLKKGRLSGWKYWDKNCNGRIDVGDSPLSNWIITATPTTGGAPITATTDASGYYTMQLFEGAYNVTETMQTGWSPSVSAGPYNNVTILSGQQEYRYFLNCKKPTCEELFTVGETDSVCCRGNFSISTEPGVTVTSLSFSVTGGVLTGTFSGCPSSNSLNFTGGLTSGTLLYPSGCNNMNMEFNAKSTTAHGRVCVRWTATFKQGTSTFTCFKDICINCERMPKECGANPTVTPATFPPVNTDWREFTVNANKLPLSQISHIDIKFVNEPTPVHIGGGLRVSWSTPFNRNWTFGNSGGYNQIRLGCTSPTTLAHGLAAASYVKFNLGVDNTINYNGVVQLKVGFCDGDTCEYTYDWRTNSTTALPSNIDTATMFANPRMLRMAVKTPERTRSISFRIGDSTTTIRAVTPPCADIENCPDVQANFRVVAQSNSAVMIFGDGSCDSATTKACLAPQNFVVNLLHSSSGKVGATIPVEVRYFDANGAQIGISTKELKSSVTSVASEPGLLESFNDVQLKGVSPNPVENNATLEFFIMESASNATATLLDIQGREVYTILDNQRLDAGSHRISFDMSTLSNGVYILKLTVDGTIKTTKFSVAH